MWLAESRFGPLSAVAANAVYLLASVMILLPKFASYRDIVFGPALTEDEAPEPVAADQKAQRIGRDSGHDLKRVSAEPGPDEGFLIAPMSKADRASDQ